MGFVDKQQKILREIVEQCKRRRTGFAPGHDSRIVLDSLAKSRFAKHLYIIFRALLYALSFEQLALTLKLSDALGHLIIYLFDRALHLFLRNDIVGRGIYCDMGQHALDLTCQGVYLRYAVNFVAEKFNSDCVFARLRREYLKHISANTKLVSDEIYIIALILYFNELVYNFVAAFFHSGAERDDHAAVVNRVA